MTTPRYPWLLFDLDDTLLDFRRAEAEALRLAFEASAVPFEDAWLPVYHHVNGEAWQALEQGRIDPAELRWRRFETLFARLGLTGRLDPHAFSPLYLSSLSRQAHAVDGAVNLLDGLRARHRFAVITNGLSDVQRPRIAASAIVGHIDHLVISEEIGVAKPDPAFFDVALDGIGRPDPSGILVIGDSLSSDIAGGVNAGLDTCWFNPQGKTRPAGAPTPTFEIRSLADLPALVG